MQRRRRVSKAAAEAGCGKATHVRGAREQDPATSAMVYPGHSKRSRSILGVGLHPSVLMQEVEQTEPHKTGSIPNIRDSIRFPLLLKLWSEKGMERQARPTTCNLRHVGATHGVSPWRAGGQRQLPPERAAHRQRDDRALRGHRRCAPRVACGLLDASICRGGERRRCRLVHTASRPPQGGVDAEGVGWRGAQTSGARCRRRASASRSARQPPLPATTRCRVRRPLCCGPPGAAQQIFGAAAEGVPWLLLGAGPPGDSDLRAAVIACVRASAASTCPCVRRGIPAHTLYLHSLVLHAAGAPAKPRTCPWSCGRSQPPEGSCSFAWPGVQRDVVACGGMA